MQNFFLAICTLLFVEVVLAGRNPYQILGVSRNASLPKIKKAFRSLSRTHHPDRNRSDPKAAERFTDITWSHEVLTNETLRAAFDRGGEEAVKAVESGRPTPGSGGFFFNQKFAGGHPFVFPGGGFPGGAFFGGMPFGGGASGGNAQPGGFGDNPKRLTRLDWFDDSAVKFITSPADLENLSAVWPDIILTLRDDSEATEKLAKEFLAVAEDLDNYFEFEVVDCRRGRGQLCTALGKHRQRPFEISIVYEETDRAKHRDNAGLRVTHVTPKSMSSADLHRWILDRIPQIEHVASSIQALTRLADSQKPTIILITRKGMEVPIRLRQLAMEQRLRAKFILVTGSELKETVLNAIGMKPSSGNWSSYAVLVTDPAVISPNTIEWIEMGTDVTSDFTVDLTLAKWVAMMKKKSGPYAKASRAVRPYEPGVTQDCNENDPSWCIFYFGPLKHRLYAEYEAGLEEAPITGKFYHLDNAKSSSFKFAKGFGVQAGTPSLIAYKGKRNKFLRYKGDGVKPWLEQLSDSSILLREGAARAK